MKNSAARPLAVPSASTTPLTSYVRLTPPVTTSVVAPGARPVGPARRASTAISPSERGGCPDTSRYGARAVLDQPWPVVGSSGAAVVVTTSRRSPTARSTPGTSARSPATLSGTLPRSGRTTVVRSVSPSTVGPSTVRSRSATTATAAP
ncbi:hypothetical protein LUX34_32225 [Streptomyces werraensis]|nr:hypothetical protein [Streptomyces werraensis]